MVFFFSSRRRHTRSDRDWSSDVCSSDLLLSMFSEHLSESAGRLLISTADAEPVCVTFAKKFILEKYEERLTVAQVARCVSLHPDYFGKIFRNATGMTLTEYTARVRVEKVKDRLPERS